MIYVKDIIDKFNGKLLCGDINLVLDNFSHDTRTIQEGDIYVGIKGESFDGNFTGTAFVQAHPCDGRLTAASAIQVRFLALIHGSFPSLLFDDDGLLSSVTVLGTAVDAQAGQSVRTQAVLGQHALDGLLDSELRALLHEGAVRDLLQTAGPAGMVAIEFLSGFVAGEHSLFRVDDDDEVAAVNVGGELGLGFAAQQVSGGNSGLAQGLARRIQDVPFPFQVALFCHISGHIETSIVLVKQIN